MKNFRSLSFWSMSKEFAVEIYGATKTFPRSEQFGLTSQMRPSAVSIPSNIAEGTSRKSDKDFSRFLDIAIGSAHELETQLEIALEIDYLTKDEYNLLHNKLVSITKMIGTYRSKL
ncbi:MAG: diversity-generating retroelement protein bAvd family protein [Fluviicola sp. XM-24bin1]|nr:MAG: diversity-generating retroelement protein bAvd family protein [Fluviicola sp. XM-24bin1]